MYIMGFKSSESVLLLEREHVALKLTWWHSLQVHNLNVHSHKNTYYNSSFISCPGVIMLVLWFQWYVVIQLVSACCLTKSWCLGSAVNIHKVLLQNPRTGNTTTPLGKAHCIFPNIMETFIYVGPDSVVCVATGYGLDSPGIESL